MVKCPICEKEFKVISSQHLRRKHGITNKEFSEMFPGYRLSSEEFRSKMSKINKENMSSLETRERLSKSMKHFYSTENGKHIRSEQMKKVWSDDEYKNQRIAHVVQRRYETGGNIIQASKMREFWADEINKDLMRFYQKESYKNSEVILKKKLASIQNWSNPTYRSKVVGNYRRCTYVTKDGVKIKCKSSYEYRALELLEELNLRFEWEKYSFLYIKSEDGLQHNYIPDVYLKDLDVYLEIKPEVLTLTQDSMDKRQSMIENNKYIAYITEKELDSINNFKRTIFNLVEAYTFHYPQELI